MRQKYPGSRVLVVDDETAIREVVKELVSWVAETVDEASDGNDALEKARSNSYDAIITDLKMPRMDGLEFLEKLRSLAFNTPVIILTAYGDKQSAVRALQAGAFDFLEKPVQNEKLLNVMSTAIEVGQRIRNLGENLKGLMNHAGVMSKLTKI